MAYNPNIPLATDQISVSQADILGNFQQIDIFTAVDHEAFGTADAGKHKKATFPAHAAPAVAGATEVGLYAALLSGNPELYINKTGKQVPFTAGNPASGWSYLPSGAIIQWGYNNFPTAGATIAFPLVFPTTCAVVLMNNANNPTSGFADGGNRIFMADSLSPISFKGYAVKSGSSAGSVTNATAYWLAIGY